MKSSEVDRSGDLLSSQLRQRVTTQLDLDIFTCTQLAVAV